MRDKTLILAIIIAVLAGLAVPFLYSKIAGGTAPVLAPPPGGEKQCVEPVEYMRKHHVDLLIQWRDARVREGVLKYVASDGKGYTISLSSTCLGCHSNKADFCDRCHNYLRVNPRCFDCHVIPAKGGAAK